MNNFKEFLNTEIEHFVIEQLMLTNQIDGSWLVQIGSKYNPIAKYWLEITDKEKIIIQDSLVE